MDTKKSEKTTFSELMQIYKDDQKEKMLAGKISPDTYANKVSRIETLNQFCGDYYLTELTDDLFYDYAKMRHKQKISRGSVKKELAIISHALNLAPVAFKLKSLGNVVSEARPTIMSEGYIGSDNKRSRRLEAGEEALILGTYTRSIYMPAAFGFAAETAIRRTELCNASRYQIIYVLTDDSGEAIQETESWVGANTLSNRYKLHITSRVNRRKRYYQPENRVLHLSADQTKTKEPRDIYLSDEAIAFVESTPASICGRLFPVSQDTPTQWLSRMLEKNPSIEDLHWHDLRHEGTTRYFEKGFEIEEVRLSTGHASLESLLRYIEKKTADVVKKMEMKLIERETGLR